MTSVNKNPSFLDSLACFIFLVLAGGWIGQGCKVIEDPNQRMLMIMVSPKTFDNLFGGLTSNNSQFSHVQGAIKVQYASQLAGASMRKEILYFTYQKSGMMG